MKLLSKCLYGLFAMVIFVACNKDAVSEPEPDPTPGAANDSVKQQQQDTLLTKAIAWDSTDLGATANTFEYVFDDQKRVKMIVWYYSDTNGVRLPAANTDTTFQFFYNGAERTAYRTIGWTLFQTYKTADVLHFYNSNNQIIKDSIYNSPKSYSSRTYTYLPDKLTTYDVFITSILPPGYNRDTLQIINNNITHAKFGFPPGIGYDVFDITYDNKINPLTKLNIASNRLIEGGHAFDKNPFLSPGYCKNNMTQRVAWYSDHPQTIETDLFQYTYNELNLPVYCKIWYSVYYKSAGRVKYQYTH
ncbi:hypothetical protein [Niastella sp. OAS944]|uniref:hypothetical protein n=1 Tax=Niastella sp. OAS944 TaxID=2664089 RepID=UPI0034711094|nr:hypothetical protein [Chitinophagaceae bacterium OAS944]